MGNKIYDVCVIGGGVIGCSIARYLSKYKGNFIVVERHNDVGDETSCANSAIVHSGYDPKPGTLKAKFNVLGNKMMPKLCEELDVPFEQVGSLTVALNDEEVETLKELAERGKINGVETKLLTTEETIKIEPNINPEIKSSLLCPTAGIVSPFELTVALMENAMDNGAELRLDSEVKGIKKVGDFYQVLFANGEVLEAKAVVDAAGVASEKVMAMLEEPTFHIIPTKGEYILLDHFNDNWIKHTLFMCPSKVGKGVLVSPTSSHDYIVGPSADVTVEGDVSCDAKTYAFLRDKAKNLVQNIPYFQTIKGFAGVRANNDRNDFIIEESSKNKNFFIVGGIMSPGLASSPAIGEYVANNIAKNLGLENNEKFVPTIRFHPSYQKLGKEKYDELVSKDPRYGKFICRCENVSEGQIVDAINRNCGATTVKAVRKRIRPGMGRCQGTFCESNVVKILSRELNKDPKEILFSELGTNILIKDSKGGN